MEVKEDDYLFWSRLESESKVKIPAHIKNSFHLRGFSNVLSFKSIDIDDINYVQDFVRNELAKELGADQIDENQHIIFFGAFVSKPESFTFNRGEIKLLTELVHIVERKSGSILFSKKTGAVPKYHFKAFGLVETSKGFFFSDKKIESNDIDTETHGNADQEISTLKKNLFQQAKVLMNSFDQIPRKKSFDESMIDVSIDDQNKINGFVLCVFCDEKKKKKKVKVSYRKMSSSVYWVMSNLKVHMRKYHSQKSCKRDDQTHESRSNTKIKNTSESDEEDLHDVDNNGLNLNSASRYGLYKKKELTIATVLDSSTAEETMSDVNYSSDKSELDSSEVIHLKIESCSGFPVNQIQRDLDDLYDEHENLLYIQMHTQKLKMINTAVFNEEKILELGLKTNVENEKASTTKIKVCEIEMDGSCLYSALAHQLFSLKLSTLEHKTQVLNLRQSVVKHLNENFLMYEHVLKGRVFEMRKGRPIKDMNSECVNFVNSCLSQPTCWGGIESLTALSVIYAINILIIHDDGSVNTANSFEPSYKRTVMILYKNQNHYESVVEISDKDIANYSTKVIQNERKRCNLNNNTQKENVIEIE